MGGAALDETGSVYYLAPDGTAWTNNKIGATEIGIQIDDGSASKHLWVNGSWVTVIFDETTAEEGPAGGPAFMSNRAATGVGV
jgi:hypothetical protein